MITEISKSDFGKSEYANFRIGNYDTEKLKNVPIIEKYNPKSGEYTTQVARPDNIIGFIQKYDSKKDKYIVDITNPIYKDIDFSKLQISLAINGKFGDKDRFNIDLNDDNWTIVCGVFITSISDIKPVTIIPDIGIDILEIKKQYRDLFDHKLVISRFSSTDEEFDTLPYHERRALIDREEFKIYRASKIVFIYDPSKEKSMFIKELEAFTDSLEKSHYNLLEAGEYIYD